MTVQHAALTQDADLHEPKGANAASNGEVYVADGAGSGSFQALSKFYDVAMAFSGVPGNSEVMLRAVIVRDLVLPANLAGSAGTIATSATAVTTLSIQDDGVEIGQISISTADVFTFTTNGGTAKTVSAGSVLTIVNQATADATAANISATLLGTTS